MNKLGPERLHCCLSSSVCCLSNADVNWASIPAANLLCPKPVSRFCGHCKLCTMYVLCLFSTLRYMRLQLITMSHANALHNVEEYNSDKNVLYHEGHPVVCAFSMPLSYARLAQMECFSSSTFGSTRHAWPGVWWP